MTAAGLKEIEMAKKDGRWEGAYDSPKNMQVPADFLRELKKDKNAYAFFQTLNKANTYAIAWRLQTAKKPETREKRMQALLQMLGQGKKLHSLLLHWWRLVSSALNVGQLELLGRI